jgi:hypothetical protein
MGALAAMPGSMITLPVVFKLAKKFNIEIMPSAFRAPQDNNPENEAKLHTQYKRNRFKSLNQHRQEEEYILRQAMRGINNEAANAAQQAAIAIAKKKEQGVTENTSEIKKKISKYEELALAANRAGDDAKCKQYQQKIQSLKQKMSKGVAEGAPISGDGGAVDNFKQQMANNTEIDYQKKQQGMKEGKTDYNFSIEDLKRLERIRDLSTLKAQAFELISKPSAKPMKPEKVEWFRGALERMNSPLKVIKLMYDLMLSGEGQSVIGSRSSMNPNVYRQRFGEESIMELGADGSALGAVAQQKSLAAATTTANNTPASGSSTTSTSTSPTTSSTPKPTPQQQAIAGDVTPDEEDALARIKSNAGLKSQYDKLIAQAK